MRSDGIRFISEASVFQNVKIESGASLPSTNTSIGRLFYVTEGTPGLHLYNGVSWIPVGTNGAQLLSGAGAPSAPTGSNGDFYIDTSVWQIYGPKTGGAWGSGTSLIGAAGAAGTNGADGVDGRTVLNGSGAPSFALGEDGDFYIDSETLDFFGPKTDGDWGAAVPLSATAVLQISASTLTLTRDHWNRVLQFTFPGVVTVTMPAGLGSRFTTTFMFDGSETTLQLVESGTIINGPTLTIRTGFGVIQPTSTAEVYNLLGVPSGQDNLSAATVPTSAQDITQGYGPSSLYIVNNVLPPRVFLCTDAAPGAAVWVELTGTGGLDEEATRDLVGTMFVEAGGTYNTGTQQVDFPAGLGPFVFITGNTTQGETLTANLGNGLNSDTFQWLRNSSNIESATSQTYITVLDDVDQPISVRVGTSALSFTSAPVTIVTANTAPVFTLQPSNQSVEEGTTAAFTVAALGVPAPTYQWEISTDSGASWGNVVGGTGDTSTTYTTSILTLADTGNQYRCVATNSEGSVNSNAATLTVTEASVSAAAEFVQTAAITEVFNTTESITPGTAFTSGNDILVLVEFDATDKTWEVVDNATPSNTYTEIAGNVFPGWPSFRIFRATNVTNIPTTVTFNILSGGSTGIAMAVIEVANLGTLDDIVIVPDGGHTGGTWTFDYEALSDGSFLVGMLKSYSDVSKTGNNGLVVLTYDGVPAAYSNYFYKEVPTAGIQADTLTNSAGIPGMSMFLCFGPA